MSPVQPQPSALVPGRKGQGSISQSKVCSDPRGAGLIPALPSSHQALGTWPGPRTAGLSGKFSRWFLHLLLPTKCRRQGARRVTHTPLQSTGSAASRRSPGTDTSVCRAPSPFPCPGRPGKGPQAQGPHGLGQSAERVLAGVCHFPRGIKGLTSAGECGRSASEGGGDRKLLLQPHRACQGEREKIPATEGTQPSLVSSSGC